MFPNVNLAKATGAMFPNVNITMRLKWISHNIKVPPIKKRAAPNGAARHFLSANALKYGDEGARPGGVI